MSINRVRRLWRQAGLTLPRKRPRRILASSRPRPLPPRAANRVWAYDFLFDSCAAGEQLKCLTVVDEFTHECLATRKLPRQVDSSKLEIPRRAIARDTAPAAGFPARRVA